MTFSNGATREIVLNEHGIALVDAYAAGGDVRYGTARLGREQKKLADQNEEQTTLAARAASAARTVDENPAARHAHRSGKSDAALPFQMQTRA